LGGIQFVLSSLIIEKSHLVFHAAYFFHDIVKEMVGATICLLLVILMQVLENKKHSESKVAFL